MLGQQIEVKDSERTEITEVNTLFAEFSNTAYLETSPKHHPAWLWKAWLTKSHPTLYCMKKVYNSEIPYEIKDTRNKVLKQILLGVHNNKLNY